MVTITYITVTFVLIGLSTGKLEPFVVGGSKADIYDFPHSAFLTISCINEEHIESSWICSASILNEFILLTAGHCLTGCEHDTTISAYVGHSVKQKGEKYKVQSILVHEKYNEFGTGYDIGLVRVSTAMTFNRKVKRVALMKDPPYDEPAQIAGWGLVDEKKLKERPNLMYINQYVLSLEECQEYIRSLPQGAICASSGESDSYSSRSWICGSSIITSYITLTAAHCLFECSSDSVVTVSVGHADRNKGMIHQAGSYILHENYDSNKLIFDIALVKLTNPVTFGKYVKRLAIVPIQPAVKEAVVAGWGYINENTKKVTSVLSYISQYVWETAACRQVIRSLPKGTICASNGDANIFSSMGDSGSALMVRDYIQIGIVSFKIVSVSRNLVVYTDTGYYYEWIKKNSKRLYCA